MKKQKITLAAAALLLATATGAAALEVKTGSDKVNVELYGQINRAIMNVDDGNESKVFHVDNINSSTRVGLNGKIEAADYLTVGSQFEVEWMANPSDKVSMEEESITGKFEERLMDIYLNFKNIGKFSVGKGKMSSDDTSEVDLSGTLVISNSDVADVGGGIKFYDSAAPVSVPPAEGEEVVDKRLAVIDVFNNIDGLSRKNRVRYDTPSFAGFGLTAAVGEKDVADIALTYSGELNGTKLKAAVAYSDPNKNYTQINGSASALFPFGFSLTAASGVRDVDDMPAGSDDPVFTYGKVGYLCNELFPVGSSALSVDYGVYKNIKQQNLGQEGTAMGVQFVQQLADWNSELYAAYRNFELEDTTEANYENINIVMGGARFKF
ncbi:MAG: Outer membrane protein (porin) [Candidatus Electronema aureum]|uniref:Outer membrane protein (Porin) n=1 Tax=Candidatus Electronema aureum TaxID=2005002 RepID=A0A521G1U5_9BACT|nr:MAG: Outer membrane protein (porin) [Candidatus Electronema aureum]